MQMEQVDNPFDGTLMFSRRENRWIPAIPYPYPPTWWDFLNHWFNNIFWNCGRDFQDCRVCEMDRYHNLMDMHRSPPV